MSPHKILNAYIHCLTHFTPLDVNVTTLEQERDIKPLMIAGFSWDRIKQRKSNYHIGRHLLILQPDPRLLGELANTIHNFVTCGDFLPWWIDQKHLVEYGIARFLAKGSEQQVAVEEPLAVYGILQYFQTNGYSRT